MSPHESICTPDFNVALAQATQNVKEEAEGQERAATEEQSILCQPHRGCRVLLLTHLRLMSNSSEVGARVSLPPLFTLGFLMFKV